MSCTLFYEYSKCRNGEKWRVWLRSLCKCKPCRAAWVLVWRSWTHPVAPSVMLCIVVPPLCPLWCQTSAPEADSPAANTRRKREREWEKSFYTSFISYSRNCFEVSLARVLNQHSSSSSAVIHHLHLMLKRKTAAGPPCVRLSVTEPWAAFSFSLDRANSADDKKTATCAKWETVRWEVFFMNAKNAL